MKIETTIKLTIGGSATEIPDPTIIELTESQARDLQRQLNKLFGHGLSESAEFFRKFPGTNKDFADHTWIGPTWPYAVPHGPNDFPFQTDKIYCQMR